MDSLALNYQKPYPFPSSNSEEVLKRNVDPLHAANDSEIHKGNASKADPVYSTDKKPFIKHKPIRMNMPLLKAFKTRYTDPSILKLEKLPSAEDAFSWNKVDSKVLEKEIEGRLHYSLYTINSGKDVLYKLNRTLLLLYEELGSNIQFKPVLEESIIVLIDTYLPRRCKEAKSGAEIEAFLGEQTNMKYLEHLKLNPMEVIEDLIRIRLNQKSIPLPDELLHCGNREVVRV